MRLLFVTALFISMFLPNKKVEIQIRPQEVITYLEQGGWNLNFDFFIKNRTARDIELRYLELKVFSKSGELLSKKYMGSNGLPGALSTISTHLEADGELYLFNPFQILPLPEKPYALHYLFDFGSFQQEVMLNPVMHKPRTTLVLPAKGKIFVDDGNDYYAHHRRVSLNSEPAKKIGMEKLAQRYALDFTIIDSLGFKRKSKLSSNNDWYGWDMKVVSPGAGLIHKVRNNIPDNTYDEKGLLSYAKRLETNGSNDISTGNYIIIDHHNGEFSVLCHFKQGTIQVKEGEHIAIGEYLGNVGLSGDSYYPHLHYQLQDSPDIIDSYGLPIKFHDYDIRATKSVHMDSGYVNSGDIIESRFEH